MKKYILFIAICCGILQSCVKNADPIFDESPSERLTAQLNEFKALLVSNTGGWLVEYYPESGRSYGGFNLYFKFNDGSVTVKAIESDVNPNVTEATSLYSFGEDMGPTINFDTYNPVLNYFSDPALPVGGGEGKGYQGDYEFIYISGNEQEIILNGKKTKNIIRMTPFPANETWENFSNSVTAMKGIVKIAKNYTLTINGKQLSATVTNTSGQYLNITNTIVYTDSTVTEKYTAPFIVTVKGIKLYQPLTVDDVEMREFTYNSQYERFEASNNTYLTILFPPAVDLFVSNTTDWYFSSENIGPALLPSWNAMKDGIAAIGEQLAYAWLGTSVETGKPSFSFGSYDGSTSTVWFGSILLVFNKVDDNTVEIRLTNPVGYEVNGQWYVTNVPAMAPFISALPGTYTLVPDNPKNITELTFTSTANAEKQFKLTSEEVPFP
jgi:hypothetical protein